MDSAQGRYRWLPTNDPTPRETHVPRTGSGVKPPNKGVETVNVLHSSLAEACRAHREAEEGSGEPSLDERIARFLKAPPMSVGCFSREAGASALELLAEARELMQLQTLFLTSPPYFGEYNPKIVMEPKDDGNTPLSYKNHVHRGR